MSAASDDWDLAAEIEARRAIAANDELLRSLPYPRFVRKTCAQGAHYMRRCAEGLRTWVCQDCGKRQPFNVNGDD